MKIGTRGHDIGIMTAEELAKKFEENKFNTIQLVAYKSIIGVSDKFRFLNSEIANSIANAFKKREIEISLIGSYFNLLEENEESLEELVKRFEEYLKFSKDLGCFIVGTETGSYNKDWSYNPENHGERAYKKVISIIKRLVKTAEKYGVYVGIEGVWAHTINTPEKIQRMIKDINSENLKIILDPVNLLNPKESDKSFDLIEKSFEYYGERIAVIHLKDCIIKNGEKFLVPLGEGIMDYPKILEKISEENKELPLIIEELSGDALIKSREYIEKILKK